MLTFRVPPPRILRSGDDADTLVGAYHRALWKNWRRRDRVLALALTGVAAATGRLCWNGRWNALSRSDIALAHAGADGPPELDDYIGMAERKGIHRLLNPGAFPLASNPLKNKHLFAKRCRQAGLPVPDTFTGRPAALAAWLDGKESVIVKPNFGSKGAGIVRHLRGEGWSPVARRAIADAATKGAIVQQALPVHPSLETLSPGALPTLRIMTIIDEQGNIEACETLLRLSRDARRPVDNFNAGNMVARVLENGCLDSAFASDGGGLRRWSVHPQTGAAIKDFELPMLAAARDLAIAAQAHFRDGFAVTGWDIGLAADGPVLIEGNWNPGTDVLQLVTGKGVAATRLGALYLAHLRNLTAGQWRVAGPIMWDRR